ncbi:MAG: response regulator [Deltaproteobacteria bacterium]|nr:response regulator [Deltaproteobacteria bacterium]
MNDRILVVDDDILIVDMIKRCLEGNGYTITTANNGEDALSLLKTRNFALVLCDIHMDGEDGFGVLTVCKALYPQTKVILCSGDIVYATLSRAFTYGADSFLAKPFLLSELLYQIKKCLPREQPKNSSIMAYDRPVQHKFSAGESVLRG